MMNNKNELIQFVNENDLYKRIKNHLKDYKNFEREKILKRLDGKTFKYENSTINISQFTNLIPSNSIDAEVNNSKIIYESLMTEDGELKRYIASYNSLWTYLAHTHLFDFMVSIKNQRKRKVPMQDIPKFFFSYSEVKKKVDNSSRALIRNNYLSYLWWSYRIALKCEKLDTNTVLEWIFTDEDFSGTLFERPSISHIDSVFGGVVRFAIYEIPHDWSNKGYELFDKIEGNKITKRDFYRDFAKRLNAKGGFINFELLSEDEMLQECKEIKETMMLNYKIHHTKTD